jgi:hypothetical protein
MHGARAKIYINTESGVPQLVAIAASCDWSVSLDVTPIFILGRFSAADLISTGMEPVSVDISGIKVVNFDVYNSMGFTKLQDLLTQQYISLSCIDRQTGETIANISYMLPTGWSNGVATKSPSSIRASYMGILIDTETAQQEEASDAVSLPG